MTELIDQNKLLENLNIKRTALWNLRKKKGFPDPVLKYPSRYSVEAIDEWIKKGGISQNS